eukprot:Blabericola_migrator_1__7110@NODE_35_length_17941_cov_94_946347_g31_i0_p4_GENE_NODE_35_length_17941_cov_94_946347_g31_i0NODE_35_length_17941_cov_94_946347_g31_i0_p4_ORF_typecomplete_len573_score68_28KAR9/PF08580_10/0_24_NODE_35_length_17941_cov_94_946347_g31_i01028312001
MRDQYRRSPVEEVLDRAEPPSFQHFDAKRWNVVYLRHGENDVGRLVHRFMKHLAKYAGVEPHVVEYALQLYTSHINDYAECQEVLDADNLLMVCLDLPYKLRGHCIWGGGSSSFRRHTSPSSELTTLVDDPDILSYPLPESERIRRVNSVFLTLLGGRKVPSLYTDPSKSMENLQYENLWTLLPPLPSGAMNWKDRAVSQDVTRRVCLPSAATVRNLETLLATCPAIDHQTILRISNCLQDFQLGKLVRLVEKKQGPLDSTTMLQMAYRILIGFATNTPIRSKITTFRVLYQGSQEPIPQYLTLNAIMRRARKAQDELAIVLDPSLMEEVSPFCAAEDDLSEETKCASPTIPSSFEKPSVVSLSASSVPENASTGCEKSFKSRLRQTSTTEPRRRGSPVARRRASHLSPTSKTVPMRRERHCTSPAQEPTRGRRGRRKVSPKPMRRSSYHRGRRSDRSPPLSDSVSMSRSSSSVRSSSTHSSRDASLSSDEAAELPRLEAFLTRWAQPSFKTNELRRVIKVLRREKFSVDDIKHAHDLGRVLGDVGVPRAFAERICRAVENYSKERKAKRKK